MEERNPNRIRKIVNGLKDRYHLSIVNKGLFVEVFSTDVSRGRLILMLIGFVILIGSITFTVIAFTPIKRLIPGYESDQMHRQQIELNKRLILAEEALVLKRKYSEVLDTVLADFKVEKDSIDKMEFSPKFTKKKEKFLPEHYLNESENQLKSLHNYHFFKPINGVISQEYNIQEKHFGVDVVAEKNEPVKAALSGKVILSVWTSETGHVISIQHSNNLTTIYKHNSVLLKKDGDFVKAGEVIGVVGNSGEFSTGPHLHFEIWHEGSPVNPSQVITFE